MNAASEGHDVVSSSEDDRPRRTRSCCGDDARPTEETLPNNRKSRIVDRHTIGGSGGMLKILSRSPEFMKNNYGRRGVDIDSDKERFDVYEHEINRKHVDVDQKRSYREDCYDYGDPKGRAVKKSDIIERREYKHYDLVTDKSRNQGIEKPSAMDEMLSIADEADVSRMPDPLIRLPRTSTSGKREKENKRYYDDEKLSDEDEDDDDLVNIPDRRRKDRRTSGYFSGDEPCYDDVKRDDKRYKHCSVTKSVSRGKRTNDISVKTLAALEEILTLMHSNESMSMKGDEHVTAVVKSRNRCETASDPSARKSERYNKREVVSSLSDNDSESEDEQSTRQCELKSRIEKKRPVRCCHEGPGKSTKKTYEEFNPYIRRVKRTEQKNDRGLKKEDVIKRKVKEWIKLEHYEGSTPLDTYLAHFKNCNDYNGWDERDRIAHLRSSLTGNAAQVLWGLSDADITFEQLTQKLKQRFGTAGQTAKYRA